MKKLLKLGTALLLCLSLLLASGLAEHERIENFMGLAVDDFADKYGVDEVTQWELYQALTDAWGDYSFWPLGDKMKFMEYLELFEIPEDYFWEEDTTLFYSHPLFAFRLERPTASDVISEEEAIEKALNWAKEQGLFSEAEEKTLKIGTALVTGDFMYETYPERLWRIELKKDGQPSILVWMDTAKGRISKHSYEAVLGAGMAALQDLVETGGLLHVYYEEETLAKPEDIPNYRVHAVFLPEQGNWMYCVDTKRNDYVFFWFRESDLHLHVTEQGSG